MWNSVKLTVASGTVQWAANVPTYAKRIVVTPLPSAAGGITYLVVRSAGSFPLPTPAKGDNNTITEFPLATATAPGTPFVLAQHSGQPPLDVSEFGIDGAHTGDTVQFAWEVSN